MRSRAFPLVSSLGGHPFTDVRNRNGLFVKTILFLPTPVRTGNCESLLVHSVFRMSGGVDRVLQLKTQRLKVQGRLDEWEQQFTRIHNRDASDADRQHSKQYRELRRLLDDIDALIDSLEGGSCALDRDSNAPRDIEKRAERGRIKCAACRYAPCVPRA